MKVDKVIIVVYIIGFLDLFGVSLTIPLLSKHARDVGASPFIAGLVGSLYGFLQLVSSPAVGRWSDRSGRKFVLLWCLFFSAISYALLGVATTVILLFMSRIPAGLLKHSQEVSKAFLADIIPKAQHSNVFGRFNSISSIGFIFGPIIGGHLSELPGGFYLVAMITSVVFLLNLGLVRLFIPDDAVTRGHSERSENSSREFEGFSLLTFTRAFREVDWTNLWDIFLVRFLLGSAVLIYRNNFSAILDLNYQASGKVTGYVIAYSGVVGTLSGFFVGRIADWYKNDDARLLLHTSIIQAITLACITVSPNLLIMIVCMTPLSIVNAVARVTSTNLTLARGSEKEKGVLMGLGASMLSLARMFSPAIGGLAQEVSIYGPGAVGTLVGLAGVIVLLIAPKRRYYDNARNDMFKRI